MRFDLVDRVLELGDDRIVTLKQVTTAEEYLQDHFPTFEVLPGVLMLEAIVQAARRLIDSRRPSGPPLVVARVRALKYGRLVKPGMALRVYANLTGSENDVYEIKGEAHAMAVAGEGWVDLGPACSGRVTLRPARLEQPASPVVTVGSTVEAR